MKDLIQIRIAPLAIVILTTLLVGGCGGDSSSQKNPEGEGAASQLRSVDQSQATVRKEHVQGRKRPAGRDAHRKKRRSRKVAFSRNKARHSSDSEDPRKVVSEKLEGLLNGGGSGKHVVTSPKRIREVLKELDEGNQNKGSGDGVDATLEKVLAPTP